MSTTEMLDCGHFNTHKTEERSKPGYTGGTGYATTSEGKRVCYACAAANERAHMIQHGRATLYLSGAEITNWTGQLCFPVTRKNHSIGYGFGREYPIVTGYFVGPDGFYWSFRNAGNMQLARCRRTKQKRPQP